MAYLHNDWDDIITIDAVLTDTGRMRMSKADGSFKIAKFALGDDEVNYNLWNPDQSAGGQTKILQQPVYEPIVNNTLAMKYKLLTLATRTNGESYLYLPVIKRNALAGIADNADNNKLLVLVDNATVDNFDPGPGVAAYDYINGYQPYKTRLPIVIDQGVDTGYDLEWLSDRLETELIENQYIIEIDNRLGHLVDPSGNQGTPSFIDDDDIAFYYLSTITNRDYFANHGTRDPQTEIMWGPKGDRLMFLIGPSQDLIGSAYLFTQLGDISTLDNQNVYYIDTTIRITGVTTGQRIDLPIRFVKKV